MKASKAVRNVSPAMSQLFVRDFTQRVANQGREVWGKPSLPRRHDQAEDMVVCANDREVILGIEESAIQVMAPEVLARKLGLKTTMRIPKTEKRKIYRLNFNGLMDYLSRVQSKSGTIDELLKKIVYVAQTALDKALEFGTKTQAILNRCTRMAKEYNFTLLLPEATS